ncbi:ABC transporter substrate-binding protein [Aestuariimicrobium soli]|uniref:ABC transporter substrate-binding protein n=1 Tax=Aestuariimicrobium soli TaxID=2035834 RepID=UPI003EBDFDCF
MNTSWTPTRRGFLGLAAAATAGLALTACGTATNTPGNTGTSTTGASGAPGAKPLRSGVSGDTLFFAGMQWGAPTSFSPLNPSPAFGGATGSMQIMYESLVRFNQLDGSLTPGLATELKVVDDSTWELPMQEGTKWSDGSELTPDDVIFTFELAKTASVGYSSFWNYVESMTANGRVIQLKLKTGAAGNPLLVRDNLANVAILPKSYYGSIAPDKLPSDANLKPLGSGPYKLESYDATQVVYALNEDYWGKTAFGIPAPKKIVHPIFKSNNDGDLKLESGEVDVSQQFTPQIWKMWEDKKKPVSTYLKEKPYYLPGGMPSLIFNLSKKGISDVNVRRAIAHAINYADISAKAMSEYSAEISASIIIPKGSEEKYFDQAAVDKTGWKYDKEKAIQILEQDAKATKGSDGIYVLPDGTRLGPWKLITPTGWTDWNTSCEIIAKSLKEIGIDVATNFPQAPQVTDAIQNGNFELAHWNYAGIGPASPWTRFRDYLLDEGVAPIGQRAYWNYGRFSDPSVKGLLADAASAGDDEAKAKAAYQALDEVFRKNIPAVPVMYRPSQFFEFNTGTWTGFPTEDDPYAPPTFTGAGMMWLFKIKKVGA